MPAAAWEVSGETGRTHFDRYADAVRDDARMNNVLQHFTTAFLDLHLKDEEGRADYLDLVPNAADGVWAVDDAGTPEDGHSYWTGFPNRTAMGLTMEYRAAE